jgi:hypothetical protein
MYVRKVSQKIIIFYGQCKKDKTCLIKALFLATNFVFLQMQDDKSNFHEKTLCAHSRYAGIVRLEIFNISKCVTDAFEIKGSICTQEPN